MANSVALSIEQDTRERRFFFAYSIFLLIVVLVGFAPSLFLRVAFETPPIPLYLHLHGAIVTGWFVLLIAQAWLIRTQNARLHRKLGYFVATYSLMVVAGGLMATLNVVSRSFGADIAFDVDMAEIDPALGVGITFLTFISGVIWSNIASVITFAALIGGAVVFRNRPDVHKRLILVGTVAILGPALARISRIEILGGEQGPFIPLALLSLLAIILLNDLVTLRKIHRASLVAIAFAVVIAVLGVAISKSDFGMEFARSLA